MACGAEQMVLPLCLLCLFPDFKDMFGFIYHPLQEENSKLNVFKLTGNTIVKSDWLVKIVKCLTETRHADDRVSIALFDID